MMYQTCHVLYQVENIGSVVRQTKSVLGLLVFVSIAYLPYIYIYICIYREREICVFQDCAPAADSVYMESRQLWFSRMFRQMMLKLAYDADVHGLALAFVEAVDVIVVV